MLKNAKSYIRRDIRDVFPEISKRVTMLYSEGSVEIKMGHYVEEDDIKTRLNKIKNYRFV